MEATMTLSNDQHKNSASSRGVTHVVRSAKKEKTEAFLAQDVCILQIKARGNRINAASVIMFVISR